MSKLPFSYYADEFGCESAVNKKGYVTIDEWDVISHEFYLKQKTKQDVLLVFAVVLWVLWPMFCYMIYLGL